MSSSIDERRRNIAQGINIADSDDIRASAREALSGGSESCHARDDALSPREFEQLITASHQIDDDGIELECRALLYLTGRLGLRKGEVAHLSEDWIEWNDRMLTIPEHDRCTKGTNDGEVCGYCRRRAKDRVEANNITQSEAADAIKHVLDDNKAAAVDADDLEAEAQSLKSEVNISMAESLSQQWQPKTSNSARRIPFDFDVRVELVIEEFFEKYDGWPASASTVNRRINRVADLSRVGSRVYPHALRATAASYHASRDISVHSLMSIMGWADPSTARAYVTANADQAAKEIRSKHR
jgi:integrase